MSKSPTNAARSANEQLYRTLIESLPVGVILADARGVHLHVNEQASRLTGYSVKELMKNLWMVHPDDVGARTVFEKALREHTPGYNYQARIVRKDGSIFWASISWRPVINEANEYAGICTVFLDISDKKNAEEELQRANERYRALAENSSDMFLEWDLDGIVTYASPSVKTLGYSPEQILGRNVFDIVTQEERPSTVARREKQLEDLEPLRHEVRIIAADGSERCLEAQVDIVMHDGKPARVHSVNRDITQRKQAEEALRESEQTYKAIVESSADMIMLTRPDGTIAYASPAARDICGYEPEELTAESPWVIHPIDTEKMRAMFIERGKAEDRAGVEYRILTKSGETRWVSHSWAPIMEGDSVQTVVSIVRDITERKAGRRSHPQSPCRPGTGV